MQFETYLTEAKQAADNNQEDTAASKYGRAIHELILGHELKNENKQDLKDVREYLLSHNKLEKHEGKYYKVIKEALTEPKELKELKDKFKENRDPIAAALMVVNSLAEPKKVGQTLPGTSIPTGATLLSGSAFDVRHSKKEYEDYLSGIKNESDKSGFNNDALVNKTVEMMDKDAHDAQKGEPFGISFDNPDTARYEVAEIESKIKGKTLAPSTQAKQLSKLDPKERVEAIKNITLEAEKKGITIGEEIQAREPAALEQEYKESSPATQEAMDLVAGKIALPGHLPPVNNQPNPNPQIFDVTPVNFNVSPTVSTDQLLSGIGRTIAVDGAGYAGAALANQFFGPYGGYAFSAAYNNLIRDVAYQNTPFQSVAGKVIKNVNALAIGNEIDSEKNQKRKAPPTAEDKKDFIDGKTETSAERMVRQRSELNDLGFERSIMNPLATVSDSSPVSSYVSEAFFTRRNTDSINQTQQEYEQFYRHNAPYAVRAPGR